MLDNWEDHPITVIGGIVLLIATLVAGGVALTTWVENRERTFMRSQGYEWVPERKGYWHKPEKKEPEEGGAAHGL